MGRIGENGDGAGQISTNKLRCDEEDGDDGNGDEFVHRLAVVLLLGLLRANEVDWGFDGHGRPVHVKLSLVVVGLHSCVRDEWIFVWSVKSSLVLLAFIL